MTHSWIVYACLGIGLSSALVAGVFLAFSDFIMRALISANPIGAIESMQEINVTVLRSVFLTTFFSLVPATIGLSIISVSNMESSAKFLVLTGTAIYLLTVILVTIIGNVPMNEKLAHMPPSSPDTISYWRHYGLSWTKLNHLRTIGAFATAVCFLLAALSLTDAHNEIARLVNERATDA